MSDSVVHSIAQHWSVDTVLLSYLIAVTGSYCSTFSLEYHASAAIIYRANV